MMRQNDVKTHLNGCFQFHVRRSVDVSCKIRVGAHGWIGRVKVCSGVKTFVRREEVWSVS